MTTLGAMMEVQRANFCLNNGKYNGRFLNLPLCYLLICCEKSYLKTKNREHIEVFIVYGNYSVL